MRGPRSRPPCGVNNTRCVSILIAAHLVTIAVCIQGQYSESNHPLPGILHTPQGSLNVHNSVTLSVVATQLYIIML